MLFFLPLTEILSKLAHPRAIADVLLVFLVVYAVLKVLRGTRAAPMALGFGLFGLLYWLSVSEGLTTLEFILRGVALYIGVAIIVLFQSEIRQALIKFGNQFRTPFTRRRRGQFGEGIYDEIVLADGAIIVRGDRIAAASCFLPLSLNPLLSKDLGTRHRAALGVTEDSDAVAIVVSEETGLISFVYGGRIKRAIDATRLRATIFQVVEDREVSTIEVANTHRSANPETEANEIILI